MKNWHFLFFEFGTSKKSLPLSITRHGTVAQRKGCGNDIFQDRFLSLFGLNQLSFLVEKPSFEDQKSIEALGSNCSPPLNNCSTIGIFMEECWIVSCQHLVCSHPRSKIHGISSMKTCYCRWMPGGGFLLS